MSYALNWVSRGPAGQPLVQIQSGTSHVLLGWEHNNVPACAVSPVAGQGRVPYPYTDPDAPRHYPTRHIQSFNVLYVDGHVVALTRAELGGAVFEAR